MRLIGCTVLLCLTVIPVDAHIDPESLVGVWEGTYEIRQQTGQQTSGPISITISKVENGRVYIRNEQGSGVGRVREYTNGLTATGYSGTTPTGHSSTTVVEGDKMHITSTSPAYTAILFKVVPVVTQFDPQSLVGVWGGPYELRLHGTQQASGSIFLTISKVSNGMVYIRQDWIGNEVYRPFHYVSRLTPTGFSHVTSEGHAATAVLEDDKLRFTMTTGWGRHTALLFRKK